MMRWLRYQAQALAAARRRLLAQPVATLLAALAMGVAISLPAGLYLALATVDRLAGTLPTRPEISVFLTPDASERDRAAIKARLEQGDIAGSRFVSRDDALARLATTQGLTDVTAGLDENPLPDAWIMQPRDISRAELTRLAEELERLPGVSEAHLDSQWAERLQAGLGLGRAIVWVLAALFAIALIAISGNTIRAQVLARRDEIQVSRLIGATDRHVRRPFLYLGALQGLLGGLAAGGVLAIAGTALRAPVERLATLYGSTFQLLPPSPEEIVLVLAATALSGWIGAWFSVSRTLRMVDKPT